MIHHSLRRCQYVISQQPGPVGPLAVFVVPGKPLIDWTHRIPGLPGDQARSKAAGRQLGPAIELAQVEVAECVIRAPGSRANPVPEAVEKGWSPDKFYLWRDGRALGICLGFLDHVGDRTRFEGQV